MIKQGKVLNSSNSVSYNNFPRVISISARGGGGAFAARVQWDLTNFNSITFTQERDSSSDGTCAFYTTDGTLIQEYKNNGTFTFDLTNYTTDIIFYVSGRENQLGNNVKDIIFT